jgi:hypothetical protein
VCIAGVKLSKSIDNANGLISKLFAQEVGIFSRTITSNGVALSDVTKSIVRDYGHYYI